MARHCSKDFSQTCLGQKSDSFRLLPSHLHLSHLPSDSLSMLIQAIQRPDAREDLGCVNAQENAIAAVTKICKYLDTGVPYDTLLPMWLSWLPVVEDKVEALHVYSYLCDLIEG